MLQAQHHFVVCMGSAPCLLNISDPVPLKFLAFLLTYSIAFIITEALISYFYIFLFVNFPYLFMGIANKGT